MQKIFIDCRKKTKKLPLNLKAERQQTMQKINSSKKQEVIFQSRYLILHPDGKDCSANSVFREISTLVNFHHHHQKTNRLHRHPHHPASRNRFLRQGYCCCNNANPSGYTHDPANGVSDAFWQ